MQTAFWALFMLHSCCVSALYNHRSNLIWICSKLMEIWEVGVSELLVQYLAHRFCASLQPSWSGWLQADANVLIISNARLQRSVANSNASAISGLSLFFLIEGCVGLYSNALHLNASKTRRWAFRYLNAFLTSYLSFCSPLNLLQKLNKSKGESDNVAMIYLSAHQRCRACERFSLASFLARKSIQGLERKMYLLIMKNRPLICCPLRD